MEIIDLEGQQVADFVAFAERNRTEWLSTTHTRSALLRLTAVVGDRLESNWRHPMFEIIRDDVGRNDIITSMCDDRRYRLDYGVEGHRSCRTNFTEALEPWGIADGSTRPFNFFQNARVHPDRTFGNEIPTGKAGDKLVLRTLWNRSFRSPPVRRPSSVQRVPTEPAHDPHPRTVARSLMRRIRLAGQLAEPISHYTDGVEAGGFLYVSGMAARRQRSNVGVGDVVRQAEQVRQRR